VHCFWKFGGLAFSSHLARNHHACPHEKMGEIGSTEALDLPFHLLASRLFSAQRSEHETNHVAVNLQISSAVNRPQRRFLKRPMVVLLNIEGNCSGLRAKPAHFSGHLPPLPPVRSETLGSQGLKSGTCPQEPPLWVSNYLKTTETVPQTVDAGRCCHGNRSVGAAPLKDQSCIRRRGWTKRGAEQLQASSW
jgi:hypothetical protein